MAILLTSSPPSAGAAALKLRDTGETPSIVRGDAGHLLAMAVGGGPVSLLDTRTQTFSAIATPAGCNFADIHDATVLWDCPSPTSRPSGVTYDIASGRVGSLAPFQIYDDFGHFDVIGDRYARLTLEGYHYTNAFGFVDRVSGRQFLAPVRFGFVRDLDAPALTRRLCRGALRPDIQGGIDLEPGEPAVAGPWTAAMNESQTPGVPSSVQLQHCGAKARKIRVCRTVTCSPPLLDDRIVAWTEARARPEGFRLVVRQLRSGRVRRTAWLPARVEPVLVDHRLYALQPAAVVAYGDPHPRGRLLRAAL